MYTMQVCVFVICLIGLSDYARIETVVAFLLVSCECFDQNAEPSHALKKMPICRNLFFFWEPPDKFQRQVSFRHVFLVFSLCRQHMAPEQCLPVTTWPDLLATGRLPGRSSENSYSTLWNLMVVTCSCWFYSNWCLFFFFLALGGRSRKVRKAEKKYVHQCSSKTHERVPSHDQKTINLRMKKPTTISITLGSN